MSDATQTCSNCGKTSRISSASGLCPRCLLSRGLSSSLGTAAAALERESVLSETLLANGRRFGDYELIEEVGRGGMGVVFKARQVSLNRIVGLKLILAGEWASAAALQRFTSEAEAAAWLNHPNIVSVYEIGQHQGQRFLAMKFIEGSSLATLARGPNRLNQTEAARIVARLARAIHYAHSRGVIHRDIKPGNVLVDSEGEPHLTDFGLARQLHQASELTQTSSILGTPAYLAPEQASGDGRPPTVAVDIYALGGILYELLAGFPAFRGSSAIETIRKVVEHDPVPPSAALNSRSGNGPGKPARIDRDLEIICLKALRKDPANRYTSAEAMAEDLERWLRHEPILARPASGVERFAKWARRHPALTSLYLVAALSVLALAIQQQQHARVWRAERDQAVQARRATESALTRQRLLWADHLDASGKRAEALASWAYILRGDPSNAIAASRIFHLLTDRNHMLPLASGIAVEGATALSLSPERSRILIGLREGLQLFDVSSCSLLRAFPGFAGVSRILAWSSDGRRAALESGRGIEVVDLESGTALLPPIDMEEQPRVAFSADGQWLVCREWKNPALWLVDLDSGTRREWKPLVESPPRYAAALHPDGRRVLVANQAGYQYFDLLSGEPAGGLVPTNFPVEDLSFSPAPWLILDRDDGQLHFWHAETLQPICAPLTVPFCNSAEFSGDGLTLATAQSDNFGQIWDVLGGTRITEEQLRKVPGTVSAWTDTGHLFLCTRDGDLRKADSRPGQAATLELAHSGTVMHAEFSPDGRTIATSSTEGVVQLWDSNSGRPVGKPMKHDSLVRYALFSPDGALIASLAADNEVRVWDAGTQELLQPPYQHSIFVDLVQWHPRGEYLLVSSVLPEVHLIAIHSKAPGDLSFQHDHNVPMAIFMPDGERLVTATHPGTAEKGSEVFLWNIHSGEQELAFQSPLTVFRLEVSPDGSRIVTAHPDYSVRLWDVETGAAVGRVMEHRNFVWVTRFSPDSKRLLTAGADGTARVWDGRTGEPITESLVHESYVWQAQFSRDASRILTQTRGGIARLWDAPTGLPMSEPMTNYAMNLHVVMSPSTAARFSPDDRRIVLPALQTGARVLELSPSEPAPSWLPTLAEALSGLRLTEKGQARVGWAELDRLQQKIAESADQSRWSRWARWFFADRSQRSQTAFTTNSIQAYVEKRIAEHNLPALQEALLHDRRNPLVLEGLAEILSQEPAHGFPGRAGLVEHLREQADQAGKRFSTVTD